MTRSHRQRKRLIPVGLTPLEYLATTAEDPLELLCGEEDKAQLLAQIDRLPDRQKAVLVLVKLEGRTQEEAGRFLGIGQRTVSDRLEAGLKNLRNFLDQPTLKQAECAAKVGGLFTAPIREAYQEFHNYGFLFVPIVYFGPNRGWCSPWTLAVDKQAYLDWCFKDGETRIPKGA